MGTRLLGMRLWSGDEATGNEAMVWGQGYWE